MPKRWTVAALLGLMASAIPLASQADLPPPDGQTRVAYKFRGTGAVTGVVLVAYPLYNSAGGTVVELGLDRDEVPFQGYTPGIYSLSSADAAALKGKDDKAIADDLAKKAQVCVKAVPRVFNVPASTRVTSMTDVFEVDASAVTCRTTFKKTIYGGADGEKGEGGVDTSGHRAPPAPFGKDLPPVGDLGFALSGQGVAPSATRGSTPPANPDSSVDSGGKDAAPHGGCAGCSMSTDGDGAPTRWLALALACALARRRATARSGCSMLPSRAAGSRSSAWSERGRAETESP